MHKEKISTICHSETHACVIENKTIVGRGYFLQDSIKYKTWTLLVECIADNILSVFKIRQKK